MISDLSDLSNVERQHYVAAVGGCRLLVNERKMPIKDAVEQIISANKMLPFISDFERLRKILYQEVSQVSSQYNTIKSEEVKIVIGGQN